MPRHCPLLIAAIALLLMSTLVAQDKAERPQVRWNAPPAEWHWVIPEKIAGFTHAVVKSEAMKREVGYNIWLPPGYEDAKDKRYPVVYYLHGAGGSELSAQVLRQGVITL